MELFQFPHVTILPYIYEYITITVTRFLTPSTLSEKQSWAFRLNAAYWKYYARLLLFGYSARLLPCGYSAILLRFCAILLDSCFLAIPQECCFGYSAVLLLFGYSSPLDCGFLAILLHVDGCFLTFALNYGFLLFPSIKL